MLKVSLAYTRLRKPRLVKSVVMVGRASREVSDDHIRPSFRTQSRACRPMCWLQPIFEPATASEPLRSKCLCIVLLILDRLHINKTNHICNMYNVHTIIVAYIATNTRLHKTTSIRYILCNHKINNVICGGQTSIYKVIIRLQKCPLEANIE